MQQPDTGKCFDQNDLDLLKQSDTEQKQFHALSYNSKHFNEVERGALKLKTIDDFDNCWKVMLEAGKDYEYEHANGIKRIAQTSRDFATSAYCVLHEMNPIIQLVKDFGSPFGSLAIGTIAFFLVVIKNRSDMEAQIGATMKAIQDSLPGLKLYQNIYNDQHQLDNLLASKIVSAYKLFISFCIEATRFYRMKGFKRWLKSVGGPNEILTLSSDVQDAFIGVRRVAEELLSKNVDRIKQLNLAQSQEIHDLKSQIAQLQQSRDGDRLQQLQALLDFDPPPQEVYMNRFEKYARDLEVTPLITAPYLEQMKGARLQEFLQSDSKFKAWQHSTISSMLILVGYNDNSMWDANQCWVSPIAVYILKQLQARANITAFYIGGLQNDEIFSTIIFSLLFQLLRSNQRVVQDEKQYADLLTKIHTYQKAGSDKNDSRTSLQEIALQIFNSFDELDTIHVVLDRVDRLRGRTSKSNRKALLKIMVQIAEQSRPKVHILAIVSGHDWHDWQVDQNVDELGQKKSDSVVLHIVRQQEVQ